MKKNHDYVLIFISQHNNKTAGNPEYEARHTTLKLLRTVHRLLYRSPTPLTENICTHNNSTRSTVRSIRGTFSCGKLILWLLLLLLFIYKHVFDRRTLTFDHCVLVLYPNAEHRARTLRHTVVVLNDFQWKIT